MLQLQVLEFLVKSLMLADLASIILLLKNAHSRRNTRREVGTALRARDVEFVDDVGTLRAVDLLLLLVVGWVAREQVDGK